MKQELLRKHLQIYIRTCGILHVPPPPDTGVDSGTDIGGDMIGAIVGALDGTLVGCTVGDTVGDDVGGIFDKVNVIDCVGPITPVADVFE